MAGNVLWQSGAVLSFSMQLSGQGQQLTNGSIVQLTNDLYNNGASGGPCFYGAVELTCAQSGFGAAINSNVSVDLYLVPSYDGTNFPTSATSGLSFSHYRTSFVSPVSGNVTRLRMANGPVPLLPVRYQGWVVNNTGQTLLSGWTLAFYGYNEAYT